MPVWLHLCVWQNYAIAIASNNDSNYDYRRDLGAVVGKRDHEGGGYGDGDSGDNLSAQDGWVPEQSLYLCMCVCVCVWVRVSICA